MYTSKGIQDKCRTSALEVPLPYKNNAQARWGMCVLRDQQSWALLQCTVHLPHNPFHTFGQLLSSNANITAVIKCQHNCCHRTPTLLGLPGAHTCTFSSVLAVWFTACFSMSDAAYRSSDFMPSSISSMSVNSDTCKGIIQGVATVQRCRWCCGLLQYILCYWCCKCAYVYQNDCVIGCSCCTT